MCGRYLLESSVDEIFKYYGINEESEEDKNSRECFPGTLQNVVLLEKEEKKLMKFKWGYRITPSTEIINARIETADEKNSFKKSFAGKRCLVPANAFFEWQGEGKRKKKYRITLGEKCLFSIAALYDTFLDKNNKEYTGFVILTRPANKKMSHIHHRMPVIIEKPYEELWLSKDPFQGIALRESLMGEQRINLNIFEEDPIVQLSFL